MLFVTIVGNSLKKNIAFVFGAHGLHLVQSVLMSLIIPKVLGVEEFGFWQLFIFYTQYGGLLHLGLNEGIYLNMGGLYYHQLDFQSLGVQLRLSLLSQVCVLILFAVFGSWGNEEQRTFVIICSCAYILLNNAYYYLSYLLQAVNRIKEFSIAKAIDISLFITFIIALLLIRTNNFKPFIFAFFTSHITGFVYYIVKTKDVIRMFFAPYKKQYLNDMIKNISIGAILMMSNISSTFIVGYGRFLVDREWGIVTFGKVSFVILLVNFALVFIGQTSLALFPELRRWDESHINSFYERLRKGFSLYSPLVFLFYLPIIRFIRYWLPDYEGSMYYLIFLLPFCIFDGKMQLMFNTMFKVLGRVNLLLMSNLIAVSLSVLLISISVFYMQSLDAVIISMLVAITARSLIAELLLQRLLKLNGSGSYITMEIVFTIAFILGNVLMNATIAFIFMVFFYCVVTLIRRLKFRQV